MLHSASAIQTIEESKTRDTFSVSRWVILVGFVLLVSRLVNVAFLYAPDKIPRHSELPRAMLSANDRSRWCTVRSLVEQGTFQIDDIIRQPGWNTIDIVHKGGHFYSSKPPFLSVLVALLYWPFYKICGWDLLNHNLFLVRTLLLLVNGIPLLIAWTLLNRLILQEARSDFAKIFSLLTLVFGSVLTTFAITLNNHVPAGCALTFALWSLWSILNKNDGRQDSGGGAQCFFWVGFWISFTACCEMPAAIMVLALGIWLGFRCWKKTALYFVPGILLPFAFFVFTNYEATGTWKPFYTGFGTELYNFTINGRPSYWSHPVGIDRGQDSLPIYLFHCLLGHHGLISLTPVTLLTLATWWKKSEGASGSLRLLNGISVGATVLVLGFYLTRTESYNYGGMTCGLRWMFWLIPTWVLAMIPTLDRLAENRVFRWFCALCLAVSIFSVNWEAANPWRHPWIFVWLDHWGWIDYGR